MPGRTPTNILRINGSGKHNPGRLRARANEPEDKRPLGKMPIGLLSDDERKAWRDIVDAAIPGVLFRSDRIAVEAFARLVAKMRDPEKTFNSADQANLRSMLSQFGMLPADRSKLQVDKGEAAKNPFAED